MASLHFTTFSVYKNLRVLYIYKFVLFLHHFCIIYLTYFLKGSIKSTLQWTFQYQATWNSGCSDRQRYADRMNCIDLEKRTAEAQCRLLAMETQRERQELQTTKQSVDLLKQENENLVGVSLIGRLKINRKKKHKNILKCENTKIFFNLISIFIMENSDIII